MCSECSEGHFGVIDSCMKCPPKSAVVVFILFVVLGWVWRDAKEREIHDALQLLHLIADTRTSVDM